MRIEQSLAIAIAIGIASSLGVAVPAGQARAHSSAQGSGQLDVPLERLPGSPALFRTAGVAFLDYDADGWIDLYVNRIGELWRNQGGTGFTLAADLDQFVPPIIGRYGAACADFDGDGLPDIACEPRQGCFYLLRNLDGAGSFLEIAADPQLVIDPPGCEMFAETFCWADLDEDGDLDLWLPAYPSSIFPDSDGNQFFLNLGASGPGGAHRFARRTRQSGLGNPRGVSRPEGAQFVDVDRDGDLDGFANGTLYQNVTGTQGPRFRQLVDAPTGISVFGQLDEGALFFDFDLDGDEDLLVVYTSHRNVIWENEGDGTFHEASGVIELPTLMANVGCSAEDWDLDGDMDMTAGGALRRNVLVESGERFLRIASHALADLIESPSPAWGDWDKDGDLDCMLANFQSFCYFLRNTTYGPATGAHEKLSVRVRPVRESALVARGLESEFGATVELRVHGDASGFVRRRFVASSHGYLQQSEYALTLALPPGPDPAEPARGVTFDLLVDFPSLPRNGILRVDSTVNPVLGGLALAALAEREITVFRNGLVRIDGTDYPARTRFSPRLLSTGALVLPSVDALAEPMAAPAGGWTVGMELDTALATGPTRVEELVLDGQLARARSSRCGANVILLDVTPGDAPQRVRLEEHTTSPRNDRTFLALDWTLKPQRRYRVLCRVSELRPSPLASTTGSALANRGALSFASPNPCDDGPAVQAPVDPGTSFLELRYRISAAALADR